MFKDRIDLFAEWVFNNHCSLEIPDFHKEVYSILQLPNKRKGIAAPRGFAKSTIVDLIYTAWCIAYGIKHYIIILSDSYTQSAEFVNTLKDELENNERFKWLYGDLMSDKWSSGEFETKNDIKISAKGLGMKIRGLKFRRWRPDLIIADDLENDESVSSSEQRKKLKRYVLRGVLPALSSDGEFIIIGTVLHWDSLLKKIVDGREEFGGWFRKKYVALSKNDKGEDISLWEQAWTVENLLRTRNDPTYEKFLGSIVFEQEYQNNPRGEEDCLINPDWIKFYDDVPEGLKEIVTAIDPAISKKETADYSAITTWGKKTFDGMPRYFCLNTVNKRLNFKELQNEIHKADERFNPNVILVESVAYQSAIKESLEGLPVKEVHPDKDKIRRLLRVQPLFEGGQVYLRRDQIELYDQLIQFTGVGDEHDDLVDSAVYALTRLMGSSVSFIFGDMKVDLTGQTKQIHQEQNGMLPEKIEPTKPFSKEEIRNIDLETIKAQEQASGIRKDNIKKGGMSYFS